MSDEDRKEVSGVVDSVAVRFRVSQSNAKLPYLTVSLDIGHSVIVQVPDVQSCRQLLDLFEVDDLVDILNRKVICEQKADSAGVDRYNFSRIAT